MTVNPRRFDGDPIPLADLADERHTADRIQPKSHELDIVFHLRFRHLQLDCQELLETAQDLCRSVLWRARLYRRAVGRIVHRLHESIADQG